MPKFSRNSQLKLDTCHQDLQTIFNYVVKNFDCTIVDGHRGEAKQNEAFDNGFSQVRFPRSRHNSTPSMAVDAIPYPINWQDLDRMRFFAGYVLGIAKMLKSYGAIESDIRSGIDWDMDTQVRDNNFNDFPHFQIG